MSETNRSREQLGRVLAHLKLKTQQHPAPQNAVPLGEAEEELLREAEQLLADQKLPAAGQPSFAGLAMQVCPQEALYFDRLPPYLVLIFRELSDPAADQEAVFRHTNSCFHCFEAYSEVHRAFLDHLPGDTETEPPASPA